MPKRRTDGPRRCRQQNGTVGIIWVQAAGPCNGDAKQFIRHIVTDEKPVEKRCARRKALGKRAAHEQIARIGDECNDSDLQIACVGGNQCKGSVFSGGSIVQKTGEKALKGLKPA